MAVLVLVLAPPPLVHRRTLALAPVVAALLPVRLLAPLALLVPLLVP